MRRGEADHGRGRLFAWLGLHVLGASVHLVFFVIRPIRIAFLGLAVTISAVLVIVFMTAIAFRQRWAIWGYALWFLAAVLFALAHVNILQAIVLIMLPAIFYVLLWRKVLSPFPQVDKGRSTINPSAEN